MRIYRKLICLAVASALLLSLAACASSGGSNEGSARIQWDLQGVWVMPDGTMAEKQPIDFSVKGTLPVTDEGIQQATNPLEFSLFEDIGVELQPLDVGEYEINMYSANQHKAQHIYSGVYLVSKTDVPSEITSLDFFICYEEGFVVVYYEAENVYLIGTVDPNADPAEIFNFYKTYAHVSSGQ